MWIVTSSAPRRSDTRAQSSAVNPAPTTATRLPTVFFSPRCSSIRKSRPYSALGSRRTGSSAASSTPRSGRRIAAMQPVASSTASYSSSSLGQPYVALALADRDAGAQIDAEAQRIAHLEREHVARQPELGDAVVQHAAGDLLLLENGHVVAEHGQIVRRGDARGARPDDRDALARGGEQVLRDAMPARLVVGGRALQMADVDRGAVARPAMTAGVLARARADPPQRARQDVGDAIELVGAPVAVLQDHLDVRGHVRVRRARGLTGDVLAHPADVAWIGRVAYRGDHPAAVGLALGEVFALVEIDLADLFADHGASWPTFRLGPAARDPVAPRV